MPPGMSVESSTLRPPSSSCGAGRTLLGNDRANGRPPRRVGKDDAAAAAPAEPRSSMSAPTVEGRPSGARPADSPAPRPRGEHVRTSGQLVQRAMFYGHLWVGVLFTVVLLVVSITGILLNHKRELGLMPDVAHEP